MGAGRRCRTTPFMRRSPATMSNRSASSLTETRGLPLKGRCQNRTGGSGRAGGTSSIRKATYSGGFRCARRRLPTTHARYLNGRAITRTTETPRGSTVSAALLERYVLRARRSHVLGLRPHDSVVLVLL